MSADFVLTLSCADRPGIVAAVTTEKPLRSSSADTTRRFAGWSSTTRIRPAVCPVLGKACLPMPRGGDAPLSAYASRNRRKRGAVQTAT